MRRVFSRWAVWCGMMCLGLLMSVPGKVRAQTTRADWIAFFAKQYGNQGISPEERYEQMLVQQSLRSFARRLNFRDLASLTGVFKDLPSPAHSPQGRDFITTAANSGPVADRKALRESLRRLFFQIPSQVRVDLQTQKVSLSGASATAEMTYSFRALVYNTPASLRLTTRPPATLTLHLRNVGERWLVDDLQGFVAQMASAASVGG